MIFIKYFLLKNCKKRGTYLQMMTWRAGAPAICHVARGTTAWVRRGAEAMCQSHRWPARGAGGAQGADTWQEATWSTWSTRVHVDASEGRHVAGKVGSWRAHGIVGPG